MEDVLLEAPVSAIPGLTKASLLYDCLEKQEEKCKWEETKAQTRRLLHFGSYNLLPPGKCTALLLMDQWDLHQEVPRPCTGSYVVRCF